MKNIQIYQYMMNLILKRELDDIKLKYPDYLQYLEDNQAQTHTNRIYRFN